MAGLRKRIVLTMTAGRTGTGYLAELLRANLPDATVQHEQLEPDAFGRDTPELSQILQFNNRGNTPQVQAFWRRKLERMLAAPGTVFAETSHLNMKAGLVENLPSIAAQADVHLVVLERAWRDTIRSLLERHPTLDLVSRWLWFLDPAYPSNLVPPSDAARGVGTAYWHWYLCEVYARAAYYRLQLDGNPQVRVTECALEDIVAEPGAAALLAALGHAPAAPLRLPPRINENRPARRLSADELAALDAWLAAHPFDPRAQAAAALAQRRR